MYTFFSDPGHAWMAVKRSELRQLNLLDKISPYSYQKGDTIYLEEDCDAPVFLKAKEDAGEKITSRDIRESHTDKEHWIRNLPAFAA